MKKNIIALLGLLLTNYNAYAIFGDNTTPLLDYYNFARHQTGVASLYGFKGAMSFFQGTANLIECDNAKLQGKVLLTAAHVFKDVKLENIYIRFVDENNIGIVEKPENVYIHREADLALIKLKKAVDTSRFRPIRLNFSTVNLVNQKVSVFGMTSVFGRVVCDFALTEDIHRAMRRGMYAIITARRGGLVTAQYHNPDGFIEITRSSKEVLSKQGKEELAKVQAKIDFFLQKKKELEQKKVGASAEELVVLQKELDALKKENNTLSDERDEVVLSGKYNELIRQGFSITISGKESLADVVAKQADVTDLNIGEITKKWDGFIKSSSTEGLEYSFTQGTYKINFFRPLGPLFGVTWHGDSGGAVVRDDGSMVGIVSSSYDDYFNKFKEVDFPMGTSETLGQYFARAEETLAKVSKGKLVKEESIGMFFLTIAPFRVWIEATLDRMLIAP